MDPLDPPKAGDVVVAAIIVIVSLLGIASVRVKHFVRKLPARKRSSPLFLTLDDFSAVRRAFGNAQTPREQQILKRLLRAMYAIYIAFPVGFIIIIFLLLDFTS